MSGIPIGAKIRALRIKHGLTQEELANRTELSKGFISQLESDQTSPSIATLVDILECLGSDLQDFFNEKVAEKIVFGEKDYFTKEPSNLDSFKTHHEVSNEGSADDLLLAFQKFLERKAQEKPLNTKITTKEYSVSVRSGEIRSILKSKKK